MKLFNVPTFVDQHVNAIIETPMGSRFKYAYEDEIDLMVVRHELPEGFTFPINFGFVPHTQAEDGDPLDILVMSKSPAIRRNRCPAWPKP